MPLIDLPSKESISTGFILLCFNGYKSELSNTKKSLIKFQKVIMFQVSLLEAIMDTQILSLNLLLKLSIAGTSKVTDSSVILAILAAKITTLYNIREAIVSLSSSFGPSKLIYPCTLSLKNSDCSLVNKLGSNVHDSHVGRAVLFLYDFVENDLIEG